MKGREWLVLATLALSALRAATLMADAGAASSEKMQTPVTVGVTIDNFEFTPATITVTVGTKVSWTNRDDMVHTVVAGDKSFRSEALDTGDAFSFTFEKAGTFDYFCSIHPRMTGRVIVKER